ncbi:hypothetical protein [Formicincola oecophyllae]|nr:hypothetical protein [Formicincola oecophyllae]
MCKLFSRTSKPSASPRLEASLLKPPLQEMVRSSRRKFRTLRRVADGSFVALALLSVIGPKRTRPAARDGLLAVVGLVGLVGLARTVVGRHAD